MNRLLTLLTQAKTWVLGLAHKVVTTVRNIITATTGRLVERWHTDGIYRRTLIAAASALSATVLPHPAAAAAVGALLADHTSHVRHGYEGSYDDEDDDYGRHRWGSARPVSLWEGRI